MDIYKKSLGVISALLLATSIVLTRSFEHFFIFSPIFIFFIITLFFPKKLNIRVLNAYVLSVGTITMFIIISMTIFTLFISILDENIDDFGFLILVGLICGFWFIYFILRETNNLYFFKTLTFDFVEPKFKRIILIAFIITNGVYWLSPIITFKKYKEYYTGSISDYISHNHDLFFKVGTPLILFILISWLKKPKGIKTNTFALGKLIK